MNSDNNELVDVTEAARTPANLNNVVEEVNSVSNVTDGTILNRDNRSLNESKKVGENDIRICKNKTNNQVLARVFYASIIKQSNKLTRPSTFPAYVPPRISPSKIQHRSIVNNLAQGDESS